MTGLEKILDHIKSDAAVAAKEIISKAEKEANDIIAAAKTEGKQKCAEMEEKSKVEVQDAMKRGESAAALQKRQLILKEKQQTIGEFIDKAQAELLELSAEEYFKVIVNMVKKYALPQEGEIIFSKKDAQRIPDHFEADLKASLTGKTGASLKISKDTRNIDGGFVLLYGDIEENCSFEALFSAAREILQDKVGTLLFE